MFTYGDTFTLKKHCGGVEKLDETSLSRFLKANNLCRVTKKHIDHTEQTPETMESLPAGAYLLFAQFSFQIMTQNFFKY